jgi:hypothetical protein
VLQQGLCHYHYWLIIGRLFHFFGFFYALWLIVSQEAAIQATMKAKSCLPVDNFCDLWWCA